MKLRSGIYVVPTSFWYIERTVWLIAGIVLLASTALAWFVNPLWILGVSVTGLVSINVALTGFCPVGTVLRQLGFKPMLGSESQPHPLLYRMQTDKWYLERRIYLAVGININIAAMLTLFYSPLWMLFTLFVGGAMVWFAATGFCVMANFLYWTGADPRLNPAAAGPLEAPTSSRCESCPRAETCVSAARLSQIPPQRV